ncbi:MAG TPA: hypothetical protein VH414_11505 [Lichenihabitans sp.]|jgi:hypothetical protein|nr:hypothetical protein [Lichenihabitans sp.]
MNVIEELIENRIDRPYVERRIEDWKMRIDDLYTSVESWLPSAWRAYRSGDVPMHEELMHRFGVPQQQLPILQLDSIDGRRGRMEPRGLWIIGANGRVDLILPTRHYLIVDREDSFEPPKWQLATLDDRRNETILDREALTRILS